MKVKQIFSSYNCKGIDNSNNFKYCPLCGIECILKDDGGRERPACPECGFVQYKNPYPGVAVVIVKDEKVLLGKRADGSFAAGAWCLPCGYIEFEEDFLTAARREVQEETGLNVEIQSIISVSFNYLAANLHTLVVVLLARVVDGELRAGDDLTELAWFPLTGPLPEMAFSADEHIIKRYDQTRLSGVPVDTDFAM